MSARKGPFKREKSNPIHFARPDDIVNPLAEHIHEIGHAFQHIQKWHFFNANQFEYFRGMKFANIVILKFDDPIDYNCITLPSEPVKLPMCKIHHLHSIGGILFGYAVEIPSFLIDVQKKYVAIVRQSAKREKFFKEVELLFQNDHLNVFHSEEGASLVTFNQRYESVDPDYLRIGAKTNNTDKEE